MGFMDDFTDSVAEFGANVADHAKKAASQGKLSYEIHSKEAELKRLYTQLGRDYYEKHKGDVMPEFDQMEPIAETISLIEELKEKQRKEKMS